MVQLCVLISKRLHLLCTTLESDTVHRFQGLRLFGFWILWVVFFCFVFFVFIYLSMGFFCLCSPSLASSTSGCHICFIEDPFGALLLLSIARQAVHFCRGLHAEAPRHTWGCSPAEPRLPVRPRLYSPEWSSFTWKRRDTTKEGRSAGGRRLERGRVVGEDQLGKKSIAQRFLTKVFFPLTLCLFLSLKLPNITSETCTRQPLPEGES